MRAVKPILAHGLVENGLTNSTNSCGNVHYCDVTLRVRNLLWYMYLATEYTLLAVIMAPEKPSLLGTLYRAE